MIKRTAALILALCLATACSHVGVLPSGVPKPYPTARPASYTPGSGNQEDGGYYYFIQKLKQKDFGLYKTYLGYGEPALGCLYWVSKYFSEDELIDYRPEPGDIIRVKEIASGIPENKRRDYIKNCFGDPVSIIVGGSSDLPIDSILYFVHISSMLNQPYYIINNNRNSKFCRESGGMVISELSMEIRDKINRLITSQRQREQNIWVDIKSIDQLSRAIDSVFRERNYQTLNLFLVTHGTEDKLIFNTSSGDSFTVSWQEMAGILDRQAKINLFLGTCYSSLFTKNAAENINIVSTSDMVSVDGDLAISLLIGLENEDLRITGEELFAISDGSMADREDNYCYYYYVNHKEYRVIDHKVTWAHKVKFGYRESDLDIKLTGFEGEASILYYQVRRIQ